MNKKIRDFIEYAKIEMKKYGAICRFSKNKIVLADGLKVNGYWDDENKVLAVATDQLTSYWFRIFVHEFAHFIQWRDGRKQYTILTSHPINNKYKESLEEIFDNWLQGKEYPKRVVRRCGEIIRDMELDCERITVQIIKDFDLPIKIEDQCRAAAAYIHFYNVIMDTRKWYKTSPYTDKKILSMMPKTLKGKFKKTPKRIREAIEERCM